MRDSHLKEVDMQLEKVYLDNIDGLLNEEDNELVEGLELKNLIPKDDFQITVMYVISMLQSNGNVFKKCERKSKGLK